MAISISTALNADAQPVESFRASTNITPQVESFQIAKSGNLTPSLYTGAMTYSLPLYTYSDPDFNIPISLEYNYDGYKVARSAGTVGLGWALNYGGVITREIRGLKDEYRQQVSTESAEVRHGYYWAYKNHIGLGTSFTINRPRTPDLETATAEELVRHLNDDLYEDIPIYTNGDSYELSPDLFHFSFGPYSGDFIMNNNGTLTLTSSTHPQGEIDVTVETTTGMDGYSLKFTIKTGDGYEYTFGDVTSAREYHISRVIKDECPDETNITGTMSGWTDTAWKLTKIKTPNGRTVLFSYAEKPNLTPTVTYSYSTYTQLLPTSASMPTPRDSVPSWERTNLNYGYSHPIEQIRVCGADGSRTESTISFSWSDKTGSEDEMSAMNYENITVSSYLNSHPLSIRNVKLSSVSVKNIDSEVVRRINLGQSIIGASSGPKRMMLESVNDSRNGLWLFEYDNGTGSLPEYDSRRHDIWGFWCQSYLDPRQQANWDDLIQSTPNFVERLDYLKSGSLTKITYPTVGWSEISYERNEADYALNRTPHNLPRLDYWSKECGGIRVKSIFSRPFDSPNGLKRLYEYSEGEILSLRWMRLEENYWKYWDTSERSYLKGIFYSSDGLSNGSYDNMIGYRQVKETLPDSSYIIHRFNGYNEYPDGFLMTSPRWLDANTSSGTTDVASTDEGISLIPVLVSPEQIYSDFRGKVKSIEEYNNKGQIRKKTTYGYTTLAGLSEYRFFNMMIGWLSFFQNRFYPKLSDIDETHYEPSYGATSKMSFNTHYTYDRQTGQLLSESSGTADKYRTTEYVYCSSNQTASDACTLKAAVSDMITRISENNSALYTGKFHFGYQSGIKGLHPVSLTEYVLDIPSSASPSSANSRTETTTVTYNTLLRPTKVDMPGEAYIKYDWDITGKHIISKTVNSEEGKTEYIWKDLVGPTSIKDPTGQITRYEYDSEGRLAGVRDSDSSLVVSYDISIMSQSGSPQNRATTLRHLSEDGSVKIGDSEFYNGLGYLCQTISESASGDGEDLITPIEYDSMFRPDSKSSLPFPGNSGIWIIDSQATEKQSQWYSSNYHDSRPFAERSFERGSSGRPLTEQKPGDIYQTSGRKIHFTYSLNDSSDSIFTFRYDYPASSSDHPSVTGIGQYQESTLSKTTAISEDNDTTQTFIDASGRLVLERRLNEGIRHDTYRIYDLRDSVVCIIQPIGSSGLYNGKEMPFNGTFIQDSCFTWQYDGKGRMTESHTPGAGTKSYLYDSRGRLIYMSDSNIIRADGNGWYYIYDDLDRLIESGLGIKVYNDNTVLDGLANGCDIKTFLYNASPLKEYCYYSRTTSHQPSDLYFEPVDGLASVADVCDTRCITMPSLEKVYDAPYYYEAYKYADGNTLFRLNSNDGYIRRAFWYDRKGRVIQKLETTSDGWTSRYTTKYDFAGNALATMETHTSPFGRSDSLLTVNTYDKRGRLTSYNRALNGQEFKTVRYSYDFSGHILKKTVGDDSSDAAADLVEDYSRDIRGWMTDITTNTSTLGSVFSESLGYMSPTIPATPQFGGNISVMSINCFGQGLVQNAYGYDHLGRLLGNNRIVDGVTTTVGTEHNIQYDLNGNINRLTRDDGDQQYTMWMTHTGNRIKDITTDLGVADGFLRSYTSKYDFNGNITNICQSNDIWYNILDLPHHSAGKTYEYYSDGTKAEFCDSTGTKLIYRGNFTYRQNDSITIWLESVAYPDGRIHSAPQIPINGYADCWYIKDHLGNVRVVHCLNSGGNLPVFEVNDYLPFGGRIQNVSQPQFSLNRYRYAGKEEHNNFVVCDNLNNLALTANDFGARFLTPFLGSWTSPDPKSSKYLSISPYAYCVNNPISFIDFNGEDIWTIDAKGNIKWKKNFDNEHRLYHIDNTGNLSTDYITVNSVQILEELSKTPVKTIGGFSINSYTSSEKNDIFNVFKFAADNTSVEWVVHRNNNSYTIGTAHDSYSSGGWPDYMETTPQASVHSHPGIRSAIGEELFSMGNDNGNVVYGSDWNRVIRDVNSNGTQMRKNYVYFPISSRLYHVGYHGPSYIRNINNYKKFYVGALIYNK